MRDPENDDLDGTLESRTKTISLLKGLEPTIESFSHENQQAIFVASQIRQLLDRGIQENEIGVFARTRNHLKSIEKQLTKETIPYLRLDENNNVRQRAVNTGTMHGAKGLEFKAVFVVSADDDVMPLPQVLAEAKDAQSLLQTLNQEKNLLYVSITRARDLVYICFCAQPSRYLKDILAPPIRCLTPI